jgi:hypothetical protein
VAKIQSAFVGLTLLALLCGCVSTTVVKTNPIPAVKATREVPEPELLDVGISIFDPGLPKTDEEREKATKALVFPEVRQAESRYFPYVLKQTLEDTGHWGAVRVIPRPSNSVDLTVQGRIVSSDGERLVLAVNAVDATGRVWIKDKEYEDLAAKLSYRDSVGHGADPFQDIYIQIANDLTLMAGSIPGDELRRIREVAELRFAQDLAPTIFDGYLTQNEEGLTVPLRLPAPEDPNVDRMRRVREREYMFFDTLDGHYAGFHDDMNKPYDEWRKYSYDEVVALHEMEREARLHKVLGAATIAGGILVDHSSDWGAAAQAAGIYGGMMLLKTGFDMSSQARVHAETLRELGDSFETEVSSLVVDIEGTSVTLSGTLDKQFEDWRRLLREIYATETGIAPPPEPAPATTTDTAAAPEATPPAGDTADTPTPAPTGADVAPASEPRPPEESPPEAPSSAAQPGSGD